MNEWMNTAFWPTRDRVNQLFVKSHPFKFQTRFRAQHSQGQNLNNRVIKYLSSFSKYINKFSFSQLLSKKYCQDQA